MIDKIILFSIKQKFIVFLFVVSIIIGGIYSMKTINLGSVPDITNNQIQIMTVAPNLSTADIEQFITSQIELQIGYLPGVEEVRSISRFGLSVVTVVFEEDMGTYLPRQLIQEKLQEIRETIPNQFGTPFIGPITTGLGEIYQYSLQDTTEKYSLTELRTIQDWIVKRQLTMIDGVIEVNSFGGGIKQYEIKIIPERLKAMNISLHEISQAIEKNNVNTGGSYIVKNKMSNFIRGEGLIRSIEELKNVVIKTVNNHPITIGDVAQEVSFGTKTRYGAFTQDGKESVGGIILMLKGANPSKVIKRVKERIEKIQKSLPEGIIINPYLDRAQLISRTTETLSNNLIEGALIVIFALVLLLGNIRGGLITASVIPLSLLFAFILMKLTNVWANLMSLGAIDFGIIVDGAVIIVEGTVYLIHKNMHQINKKEDMDDIAFRSASTMMNSAFFGQLIILIVFVPILFLTGIEGKMFHPMAYTFGFAVIGAIVLCLTYVPMMSAFMMKPSTSKSFFSKIEKKLEPFSDKIIDTAYKIYHPVLAFSLHKKGIIISGAIILFLLSLFTFSRLGGEFVPQLDEGDLALQALIKPGSSLDEMIRVTEQIENILKKEFPDEIITSGARIGVADIPTDPMPMDIADMFIILEKDYSKWKKATNKSELIQKIEEKLNKELVGVNFVFSQPIELRFNELLTGVREDVAIKIFGEDLNILNKLSQKIATLIQDVPGVADVNPERISGLPQITIQFNRKKIARYGLSIAEIADYISTAYAGKEVGIVFEGEKRFDIVVRLSEQYRKDISQIRKLYIPIPDGNQIPLSEVADISYIDGPMQISRENTFRRTYIGINVRNRDVESVIKDIQKRIDEKGNIPPGYHLEYGGAFENLQRAKKRLSIVVPIVLVLIFILLYFALQSFRQAMMIYFAIPLAAIGGIYFLALREIPFSISAGVGFIVLFGVAILNGLVLINRLNTLKKEGMKEVKQRIFSATKERLRPIMLTATTDILGFFPMAFSTSAGAEVQRPLATVVIGGLLTATLLTLIVLPVLYYWIETKNNQAKNPNILPVTILFLFLLPLENIAQKSENKHTILSVEEAIEIGLKNNGDLQNLKKENEKLVWQKKAAFNLPKTGIEVQYGQFNTYENDVAFTFSQSFEFPTVYITRKKISDNLIKINTLDIENASAKIKTEIKMLWNTLGMLSKKEKILANLDSIYQEVIEIAQVRYRQEEITYLEKVSLEAQSREIHNRKNNLMAEKDIIKSKLRAILNDTIEYDFLPQEMMNLSDQNIQQNLLQYTHPILQKTQQEISLANSQKQLSIQKALPDFSLGYFRYSMKDTPLPDGSLAGSSPQFSGIIGQISIPLFYSSYKNDIQQWKITAEQAAIKHQYIQTKFKAQYQQTYLKYLQQKNNKEYYETIALKKANEIEKNAVESYKNELIPYHEFVELMQQSYQIRLEYYQALHDYNESIIMLNYLLNQ